MKLQHTTRGRRQTAAALVLAASLTLTACGGSEETADPSIASQQPGSAGANPPSTAGDRSIPGSDGASGTVQSVPDATESDSGYVPVPSVYDFGPYSIEDRALVTKVREQLITDCMSERGFEYAQNLSPETHYESAVPLSLDKIPTQGYQQFQEVEEFDIIAGPDDNKPGYLEALEDEDGTGCTDEAFRKMYGVDRNDSNEQGDVIASTVTAQDRFFALPGLDIDAQLLSNPLYLDVSAQWSQCMNTAGFDFADVDTAIESFMTESRVNQVTGPSDTEVQAATADYECRKSAGFYSVIADIQQERIDQWLDDNSAALSELDAQAEVELSKIREQAASLGV